MSGPEIVSDRLQFPVGEQAITIGYRTPGLGRDPDPLDAAGKMALARELSLAVVEPQCAPHEIADIAAARELKHAAEEAGVGIPSVGCLLPLTDPEGDLAGSCDLVIEVCAILGCDYTFAVPRNPPDREEPQAVTWRRLIERSREAVARLGDAGIALGIEADHGAFVHTCERTEQLLDAVDGLCANFDPCNLYLGGSDPVRSVARLAGRIRSGHIKDGRYRCGDWQEAPVGEGELDWAAIFRAMRDHGVACPMHIEHCQRPDQVRAATRVIAEVITEVGSR